MVEEFTRLNGVPLLEAIQYNSEGEQRVRAAYILDHHFPSFSEVNIAFACYYLWTYYMWGITMTNILFFFFFCLKVESLSS